MTNFKEHDGMLFKMLDKPVPLTPDAEMPCLVRFRVPFSKRFREKHEGVAFFCDAIKKNPLYGNRLYAYETRRVGCIAEPRELEIIGYPVADGSKEWALYQMMQGKWVYNPYLEKHKSDKIDTRCLHAYSKFGQDVVVKNILTGVDSILGAANISHWTNYAEPTGWQIYHEPKPLLADAKVGDLVKLRNGSYSQIAEIKDGSVFKYQNPEVIGSVALFWCDENGDTSRWGKVKDFDIIFSEPLAPEGTKEWAWQMMLLGKTIIRSEYSHENATWKMNNGTARSCLAGMSACSKEQWVANAIDNGWKLYKEPKPEPIFTTGDKVTDGVIEGTIIHIEDAIASVCPSTDEYKIELCNLNHIPESPKQDSATQYKVGDWVEWSEGLGISRQSQITRVSQSAVYSKGICIPLRIITKKLDPSEVIVHIGCLSGTIAKSSDPNYFLMLHSRPVTDCNHSIIRFSAIDTETRSLVESLLKAQKEEE